MKNPFLPLLVAVGMIASAKSATVSYEITGTVYTGYNLPDISSINGTKFSAILTYDPLALPTSVVDPYYANFTTGNINYTTQLGSLYADQLDMQVWVYGSAIFSAYSTNIQKVTGFSGYTPKSVDFDLGTYPSTGSYTTYTNLPNTLDINEYSTRFIRISFGLDNSDSTRTIISQIESITTVPEPSTYALFGLGAIGMLMVMRRKKMV